MLAIATTPPPVLPRAVSVLLLLGLGVMAAQMTWQLLEPDVRPAATIDIAAESVAPTPAAAPESPFATVARLPLFGVLGERAAPEPVVAPETRLRLRLVGLMAGTTRSRATRSSSRVAARSACTGLALRWAAGRPGCTRSTPTA
jgi:hypothetical protein